MTHTPSSTLSCCLSLLVPLLTSALPLLPLLLLVVVFPPTPTLIRTPSPTPRLPPFLLTLLLITLALNRSKP